MNDGDLYRDDPDFAGVECPDCGTGDVTVASLFGSTTSEVLFQCDRCRSCFNWVKWRHRLPPVPARNR
jgi:hypothetical protein